ncbi:MAG: hypothetical protein HYV36_02045 [Lentisphaerae bacterium]|nr:hypothetical protein [Lentisphaerota bacterium]
MPELFARGGAVEWHSALVSGARHWLLYAGPVEKRYQTTEDKGQRTDDRRQKTEDRGQRTEDRRQKTEDRGQTTEGGNACEDGRFIFHRLHAEFNALRLDEHLDLTGAQIHDVSCWNKPGVFGLDYRERARRNVATLLPLREAAQRADNLTLQALLDPQPKMHRALANDLFARFEKWVRQFQGWRKGQGDYAKNVIGFSRRLRGLLIAYELLRKDGALNEEQVGRLHSYFVFAARRILDEGRWPHSRTALHPDHPESCRDFYAYGGEHKPDRLYWTNSLPNFQSDPMCALLHLSAVIPEHPEAAHWRSFALDDLERQINAYCGKSGAWEESINYALYTLSYFIITFRIAKHRLDLDYFQDERMRRFAGWLTRFLGPLDKRWNQHTFPGIGNALCPSGGGEYLLCFASELDPDDPLRADLMAAYQRLGPGCGLIEHYPVIMAAMADVPERDYPLRPLSSEYMDELGVAMRHGQPSPQSLRASVAGGPGPRESYLFQKIGFFKDHYEADETAFNWYAKGTPLCMDYGTYTIEASVASAHNLVEIPDQDSLRRGYLEQALFSAFADYTHCEMPVTLKLLWGRGRSFEEVDAADGLVTWEKTPYYYIGDDNPVGPKTWKTRLLLFVKPDYVALFDRVYGDVPHRFCLHVVGDRLRREGALLKADGRFDLDLLGLVQHPAEFDAQTGALVPRRAGDNEEARRAHAQSWFRIYNRKDGIYRTVLFARERSRAVTLAPEGPYGIRVTTPEYTDYVFLHNEPVETRVDGAYFAGRVGWIRREAGGAVRAVVPDGRGIAAFGLTLDGRGPWVYNEDDRAAIRLAGGAPRVVRVGGE